MKKGILRNLALSKFISTKRDRVLETANHEGLVKGVRLTEDLYSDKTKLSIAQKSRMKSIIKSQVRSFAGLTQPQMEMQLFDANLFYESASTILGTLNYRTDDIDLVKDLYELWEEAIAEVTTISAESKVALSAALESIDLYYVWLQDYPDFKKEEVVEESRTSNRKPKNSLLEDFKSSKEVTSGEWMSTVRSQYSDAKFDTDEDDESKIVATSQNKTIGSFNSDTGRCSVTYKDGTSIGKPIKSSSKQESLSRKGNKMRSVNRRKGVRESLEVTDEIYVVKSTDTGEVLSDLYTGKEEAVDAAQVLANEIGEEVLVESIGKKAKLKKNQRRLK